jgi:hypothetical protein
MIAFAVTLFVLGVLGVLAVFTLYATGHQGLPVWLPSAVGGLTVVGFALGLVVLFREARRS